MMAKRAGGRKYQKHDDQFRASAVCMLQSQGYPGSAGALAVVARHLKVSESTLRGWFLGTSNPPPANIREEKRDDLLTAFMKEIYEILKVLPNARQDASYQQLTTSLAIFFDKTRLLQGLPIGHVKNDDWRSEAVDALRKGEITPDAALDVFGDELARELFALAGVKAE